MENTSENELNLNCEGVPERFHSIIKTHEKDTRKRPLRWWTGTYKWLRGKMGRGYS